MNDQDLREQFETWAQPLHNAVPPPTSVIERRATRRRARIGAACAAGLAVAVVTAVLLFTGGISGQGEPGHPAPPLRGRGAYLFPPDSPYLATLSPDGGRMAVRNAATGAALSVLRPQHRGDAFTRVAASQDDRLFIVAEQASRTGKASFFAVRLTPHGRLNSVQNVPWASVSAQIYGIAVSPDDSAFAVATMPLSGLARARVQVFGIDHQRGPLEWTSPGGAGALSWADNGTLAFDWQGASGSGSGLRILHVPATGSGTRSLLGASRLAVPAPQYVGRARTGSWAQGTPQLTEDGKTVLWDVSAGRTTQLDEFSAATGRLLRRFPMGGQGAGHSTAYCGVLWASRTGDSVLTQCARDQEWISRGRVHKVRLALTIPDSMVGERNTFAW
jgi:hypothetical protein